LYDDTPRHDGARFTRDGDDVVAQLRDRKRTFDQEMIRLRWADDRSNNFERQLGTLVAEVESYLDIQDALLPRISTQIPAAEQRRLAERLTAERGLLPVQAHPDLPSMPWLAVVLAPVVALADRIRDRFATTPG
jgi:hypothetical protein